MLLLSSQLSLIRQKKSINYQQYLDIKKAARPKLEASPSQVVKWHLALLIRIYVRLDHSLPCPLPQVIDAS